MKPAKKIARQLGKRIRELREAKNWSQEQLAVEADVDNSHLGTIERGEGNPTLDTLVRIATALEAIIEISML